MRRPQPAPLRAFAYVGYADATQARLNPESQ